MKRRCTALLTAVALLLCLLPAPVRAAGNNTVCFMAVNDTLIPLDKFPMPLWVGGLLYAPVGIFDPNSAGVSLGFFYNQSRTGGTVTLYNPRQMLIFDMVEGVSRDQFTGEVFSDQAITRSGNIYLPVDAVCSFFGLTRSYVATDYGLLLRVKSENCYLSDDGFIDAASSMMKEQLDKYNQSQIPTEPDTQPPTPPSTSNPPPAVDPPPANVRFCLAFRCDSEEGLEDILELLAGLGCRGLFFFRPDQLIQRDDLVRRVLGAGHSVGLLAEGEDLETTRAQLNRGNELLSHIARTAATAALVPADQAETLEEEGWSCWRETLNAVPGEQESAGAYLGRLERAVGRQERTVYLTLDGSQHTARLLSELLRWIKEEEYTVLAALETRL